jgi:hypothetical protein
MNERIRSVKPDKRAKALSAMGLVEREGEAAIRVLKRFLT